MTAPARVLIVEDDDSIQEFMSIALGEEGYAIASASQGKEALDAVLQFCLDVILLDLRMPLMDGQSFVKAYRQLFNHTVPIIVISALRDAHEIARQMNATDVLTKPFELNELFACIKRHAGRKDDLPTTI